MPPSSHKLCCPLQWFTNHIFYIVLLASICTIFYQQHTIRTLKKEFLETEKQNSVIRHKRSVDGKQVLEGGFEYSVDTPPPPIEPVGASVSVDQPFYFPLYTQLSSKALEKICHEKFNLHSFANPVTQKHEDQEDNRTKLSSNKHHSKSQAQTVSKLKHRKMLKEKVCTPIQELGHKQMVGHRMYHKGSAIRHANHWLLTEYTTGNTLFYFDLSANNSTEDTEQLTDTTLQFPTTMHTLTESFQGTDHAVSDTPSTKELVFYYHMVSALPRIQALHLESGRRMSRLLNATKTPLYTSHKYGSNSQEFSSIDLEIDQSALWAIYKQPGESSLTISKMSPYSLKEVDQWQLKQLDAPSNLLNTFISCGVLYTVSGGDPDGAAYWIDVQPVFDFRTNRYLESFYSESGAIKWLAFGHISNVQYDAQTDSVNVFDSGNIYTMAVKRKRFV